MTENPRSIDEAFLTNELRLLSGPQLEMYKATLLNSKIKLSRENDGKPISVSTTQRLQLLFAVKTFFDTVEAVEADIIENKDLQNTNQPANDSLPTSNLSGEEEDKTHDQGEIDKPEETVYDDQDKFAEKADLEEQSGSLEEPTEVQQSSSDSTSPPPDGTDATQTPSVDLGLPKPRDIGIPGWLEDDVKD
jgi:hypothetical protein